MSLKIPLHTKILKSLRHMPGWRLLDRRVIIIIVCFTAALLIIAAGALYIHPALDAYREVQQAATSLKEEVDMIKEQLNKKDILKSRLAELLRKQRSLDFSIPTKEETPRAFMALDRLLSESHLEITSLSVEPMNRAEDESYYFIDIDMVVQGTRDSHLSLIRSIESFPYLLVAHNLQWDNKEGHQQMSLALRLYIAEQKPLTGMQFDLPAPIKVKENFEEEKEKTKNMEKEGGKTEYKEDKEKPAEESEQSPERSEQKKPKTKNYNAPIELGVN